MAIKSIRIVLCALLLASCSQSDADDDALDAGNGTDTGTDTDTDSDTDSDTDTDTDSDSDSDTDTDTDTDTDSDTDTLPECTYECMLSFLCTTQDGTIHDEMGCDLGQVCCEVPPANCEYECVVAFIECNGPNDVQHDEMTCENMWEVCCEVGEETDAGPGDGGPVDAG